jgi:hypothetical protein
MIDMNTPHTFLQHMYIPPKLIFGLAVACADKVQRDMHVRGPAGLGGVCILIERRCGDISSTY